MKAAGGVVVGVGCVLIAIGVIWGMVGYYVSQTPALLLLLGAGLALIWVGARMNRDKNPTAAVEWRSPSVPQVVPETVPAAVPQPVSQAGPAAAPESDDPAVTAERPVRVHVLTLADGSRHPVVAPVVVGRAPVPLPGLAADLWRIDEANGTLSKSHALAAVVAGRLVVRDLGSTNGTVVVDANGAETICSPGVDVPVLEGATVELGDLVVRTSVEFAS